jgi:hypothetical protein
MVLGNDMTPEIQPLEKPYPGRMAMCKPEGSKKSYTFYIGGANQRDMVVFVSNEDNSTVDYIMKGITMIPKIKDSSSDSLRASGISRLPIKI